jgi:probable rRNA maturation factor
MPALTVSVTDESGRAIGRHSLAAWLAKAAPARAAGHVGIALVSDRSMRALNRRFRGVDRPTDVLSFPAAGGRLPAAGKDLQPAARSPQSLGDIAIALGVARRQAREQRHSVAIELRILALHGLLHLLGYDHEVDRGRMRRAEDRLRRRAGLPSSLIGRGPAKTLVVRRQKQRRPENKAVSSRDTRRRPRPSAAQR